MCRYFANKLILKRFVSANMSRHTFNLFVSSSEKEPTAVTPNTNVIPGAEGTGVYPKKFTVGTIVKFIFYKGAGASTHWPMKAGANGVHIINGDWLSIQSASNPTKTWETQIFNITKESGVYCSAQLNVANTEGADDVTVLDGTKSCTIKCISPRLPSVLHATLPFPVQVVSITLKEYELTNMETLPTNRVGTIVSATEHSHQDFLHLTIDEFTANKSISNLPTHAHEFATLSTGAPGQGREDGSASHTVHRETEVTHSFDGQTVQFQKFTLHIRDKDGNVPRMHNAHFWFTLDHVEGLRGHC